jgi:hypothetical protein
VTEYEEVTLRVGDRGWLYRENTDPIEWARAPDLADKELATDNHGWVSVKDAWVPDQEEPVEPGTLEENIQRVTAYNWQLVEADIPYFVWSEGVFLNIGGPPAFAVDAPAPNPSEMVAIFCAGVGNVDRRLLGRENHFGASTIHSERISKSSPYALIANKIMATV